MDPGQTNEAFDQTEEELQTFYRSSAVKVTEVCLVYGKGNNAQRALDNISIDVPRGKIYALLGPSGCGKTSLLCCLIDLRRPQKGNFRIFGEPPGTSSSGVPGPWIGYMPQDLTLHMELTAEETLLYYGRLQRVPAEVLEQRIPFLMKLLDLGLTSGRQVVNMSGGQQRRLSLAAAMVHSPPLLILDEPTVGVDPVLRMIIWKHLIKICQQEGTTILITTHYIEEARKAHRVGLMREGRILKEGRPRDLMREYNSQNLDGVFFQLCSNDFNSKDNKGNRLEEPGTSVVEASVPNTSLERELDVSDSTKQGKCKKLAPLPKVSRNYYDFLSVIWAVTLKNLFVIKRNIVFLMITFTTPIGNMFMIKLIYGHTPYGLSVAIANTDKPPVFSKLFLERIDKASLTTHLYPDKEDAINAVRYGKAWGALYFPEKYSFNMIKRARHGFVADNASLWGSLASLHMDQTNIEISRTIFISLLDSMAGLVKDHVRNQGDNPRAVDSPMVFKDPIYGTMKTEFTDFTLFNFLPDTMFLMAMGLSALTIIAERSNGLFDRSRVSGLTPLQVLISHVCIQNVICFAQACGLIIFLKAFSIESVGSLGLVGFLCFIQGNVGMAVGIFVSSLTTKAVTALYIILGFYQNNLLISGCVWPIAAFPHWLRPIGYCGPDTFTLLAVRETINRGFDWTNRYVWASISISCAWTLIPILAAIFLFKRTS